ncbi:MAG: hypothetical protein H6Q00_1398 [Holophagaceae bacterium]|nr:hypothetical protein [Holophagaceae bacterium]
MSDNCQWERMRGEADVYDTECGHAFEIDNGYGVRKNGFQFCPYCGKPIYLREALGRS